MQRGERRAERKLTRVPRGIARSGLACALAQRLNRRATQCTHIVSMVATGHGCFHTTSRRAGAQRQIFSRLLDYVIILNSVYVMCM